MDIRGKERRKEGKKERRKERGHERKESWGAKFAEVWMQRASQPIGGSLKL